MIQEVVQQLSGALLVRMLHTRDGAKVGVTCVMHGSNKVSMVLRIHKGYFFAVSQQQCHLCISFTFEMFEICRV